MQNQASPRSQATSKKVNRTIKGPIPHRLHEDVITALDALGIVLAPGALDTALSMAEKESLGHLEFLHRLLAGPVEARREHSLKRRLDNARFRELVNLEGFDWQFNAKGLDRRSIEQLVTCDRAWASLEFSKLLVRPHVYWVTVYATRPAPSCSRSSPRRWPTGASIEC
jgi:IstB-like ATP binding protein